jgi:cytochrome c-type biogenesis protein CcmH
MKALVRVTAAAIALAASLGLARAADAPAVGTDPALEQRVEAIGLELRCLVCQNQTIADSQAGLAVDLREKIREQLKAGKSEAEIKQYMVERYGDFVLYKPPLKATTVLLWVGPFALMAIGIGAAVLIVRRRRSGNGAPQLTEEQRRQAARLLADEPEIRT